MTKILGLAGKKQSGKNTSANYIFGSMLVDIGVLFKRDIAADGQLIGSMTITDDNGKPQTLVGNIDPLSRDEVMLDLYARHVWQFVKFYSFADPLKEFCIDVLGLTVEQVYGTNEQKESKTHLLWENMPVSRSMAESDKEFKQHCNYIRSTMTAREVMQYFGTDICRSMYHNVWVDATIRQIKSEQSGVALIPDVRFPNEVEGIQKAGGKVIRLLRAPFAGEDQHASETALDDYPLEKFDAVIDNAKMSIPEQNKQVVDALTDWGWDLFEV